MKKEIKQKKKLKVRKIENDIKEKLEDRIRP